MKNKRQIFKIEKLLNEAQRWSKSDYARTIWVVPWAVNNFFKEWARTRWKQREYAIAFNKCFETNYSYKELFSLVD